MRAGPTFCPIKEESMSGRGKRFGWGLGSIGAIAAVLLLLPISAAGSFHASAMGTTGEKRGALSEAGRPVMDAQRGATGSAGGFLGTATISAAGAVGPNGGSPRPSGLQPAVVRNPTSPQLLGSFPGVNVSTGGFVVPPDTQIGQGGVYVFELVNDYAKITSTSGATVYSNFTIQSFFGVPSTDVFGAGQVIYDQLSHRWFVAAYDATTNFEYFDVSKSGSPVGAWWAYSQTVYFTNGAAQFMSQPLWGVSKSMFGMSTSQLNSTTFVTYGVILMVVNKVKAENGHFSDQLVGYPTFYAVDPARNTSSNGTGTDILYWATISAGGNSTLTVIEAKGVVGTLSFATIAYTVAYAVYPPSAVQPGTTSVIFTGDARVSSASWSGLGILWVTVTVGCTPTGDGTMRSCIRVVGINTVTNALVQDTNTAVAGLYLYYGAITALTTSGAGYLMVLGFSGALSYPSIAVTGQNSTDAFGSFRGPVPVFSGTSYDSSGRYGDFSGIQLTMVGAKATAWGASESDDTSGWTTEVVHFAFY
jgi:hypothetical protein